MLAYQSTSQHQTDSRSFYNRFALRLPNFVGFILFLSKIFTIFLSVAINLLKVTEVLKEFQH